MEEINNPIDEVQLKEVSVNNNLESSVRKSAKVRIAEDAEIGLEEEAEIGETKQPDDFTIQIDDGGGLDEEPAEEEKVGRKRRGFAGSTTYAAKKTVAQGMMDIALITANANQLRFVLEFNRGSSTYHLNVILIAISLLLQIGVGVSLIFKGRLDLKGQSKDAPAKRINNFVVLGVFLVTIINVFIGSFTISGRNDKPNHLV